jgi:hypothetical protein
MVFRLGIVLLAVLAGGPACADDPVREREIEPSDREHWSFRPVRQTSTPVVQNNAWLRTSIDSFILARLEKRELTPVIEADRATLLRRLSFDLRGLPPSLAEIERFEEDNSPDAYERLVDRLLASPACGESWAQHWLDLARYADTDGFEHDKVRPDAWKYRDWVIAALNADLPYDRFVAEQLAGDLLGSPEGPTATMFCLAGPDMPDINDQAERRHTLLNDMTATVGSVLLGLQLGCAQCHDHKYDPLSQADFYRLRAVFEPAVPLLKRDVPCNMLSNQNDTPAAKFWVRGDHRRPGADVPPGFPRIASAGDAWKSSGDTGKVRLELSQWLFRESNPLAARVIVNRVWQHHFGRGLFETSSDAGLLGASPSHPELLDHLACNLREQGWSLKQLHREIVCSATYRQASKSNGDASWMKRLQLDPQNERLSRFPRRRLEGETLRDSMLAAAGLLSSERGGSGVMPPLPKELVDTLLKGQWTESPRPADHYRRSVYLFARRNLRYPVFDAFDRPDANASCPVRTRSTTATQSLIQFNSELSLVAARHLAGRVLAEATDPAAQVEMLYRYAYSRRPTANESAALTRFLAEQRERIATEKRSVKDLVLPVPLTSGGDEHQLAALVDACLAVLNSSAFLYLD